MTDLPSAADDSDDSENEDALAEQDYQRRLKMAFDQFDNGRPLGAREGWQPTDAWERKQRALQRGLSNLSDVSALLWCRLHVNIAQTNIDQILLHVTFQNLWDEWINTHLGEFRFLYEGRIHVYDEEGIDVTP